MSRYIDIHTHRNENLHLSPRAEGRHPWEAELEEKIIISSKAEVIGEIGLDFACSVSRERQEEVFLKQLTIAQERGCAVVLHCVKAFEQIMKILDNYSLPAVIFHGFIGSKEQAQRAVNKGYYLSFGGRTIKSPKTIEALRNTPISNIFAETDEGPETIEQIYEMIASIRGITIEMLIDAIKENYERIFNDNGI
jgi:TatD DNase family protein